MSVLAVLIAATTLVVPPLGVATPWQGCSPESPRTGSFALFGPAASWKHHPTARRSVERGADHRWPVSVSAPSLWGAAPLERVRWRPPNAAVDAEVGAENMAADAKVGGGVIEDCPGDHRNKCSEAYSGLSVCTQLLDAQGDPLEWGERGTFWDIFGPPPAESGETEKIRWGEKMRNLGGDSLCLSATSYAWLIKSAGCENVNIRCNATGVEFALEMMSDPCFWPERKDTFMPVMECLRQQCYPDVNFFWEEEGFDKTYIGVEELTSFSDRAGAWNGGGLIRLVGIAAAGGIMVAAIALGAIAGVRRRCGIPSSPEPLLG